MASKYVEQAMAIRERAGGRRHKADPGDCEYCDRERASNASFHPSHDASERCQSGKHSHCSCDTCF